MNISRRNLLSAVGASAVPAALTAQTFSSVRDPQIATLVMEGRVPLKNMLPDPSVALPPELIQAINAGVLEQRGRLEFNRTARLFRVHQIVVPPSTPFPLPEAPTLPDRTVGSAFDLSIEHMSWNEWKSSNDGKYRVSFTAVGRCLALMAGPNPAVDEFGVVELSFYRDAPHNLRMFTLSFAGAVVIVSTDIRGTVELDPAKTV